MELKDLIEELQSSLPHVGPHALVESGPVFVQGVHIGNGRVIIEVPEPDIEDYPDFKAEVEAADTEAERERELCKRIKEAAIDAAGLYRKFGKSAETDAAMDELEAKL